MYGQEAEQGYSAQEAELQSLKMRVSRPMTSCMPRRTESQELHLINRRPLAEAISVSDITLMARRRRLHTRSYAPARNVFKVAREGEKGAIEGNSFSFNAHHMSWWHGVVIFSHWDIAVGIGRLLTIPIDHFFYINMAYARVSGTNIIGLVQ
ncbi:hypothetical protein BGZ61DRAFT_487363 [Ilyonectria robusta]|uniref:uncharacterized protein n=1 Tax=Ilyonectria robusta TaxID=1079257 RepID=UPI001E8D5E35|nr:uncharacterized protein BGZ61DRAFT_487363 [Ilyonectria robusta]KAH8652948.1 hypothetical protein BGZ61DRAFT_487363 [Ilyonectria robusta]